MLSDQDKEIIKNGTFQEQIGSLIDHFHDLNDDWIIEARKFFRRTHKEIFKKK